LLSQKLVRSIAVSLTDVTFAGRDTARSRQSTLSCPNSLHSILILFSLPLLDPGEPGTSVSIVSGYGLDDQAIEVRFPAGAKDFFL
jgi:hypothetical protein